jgi:sarcosine oxidase
MKFSQYLQSKKKFDFDAVVIGNGLIGAAAAKYLQLTNNRVAAIGAEENIDPTISHVYSSHYDEGRVQRVLDYDRTWHQLNKNSVAVYKELQANTGISFHNGVGCLFVTTYDNDSQLNFLLNSSSSCGTSLNYDQLRAHFPQFTFPSNLTGGYLEYNPAGYIQPRLLIQAQLKMFTLNKGKVLNDTVIVCRDIPDGVEVECMSGNKYTANKALVAGGAFTNFFDIIPRKLDLILKGETVLLAEISAVDALALSHLPSLLYEIATQDAEGIYMTPPLFYPATLTMRAGWYIKLGCNLSSDPYFTTLQEVQEWFRSRSIDSNIVILQEVFKQLMPTVNVLSFTTKRCILTRTPSKRQFIGKLENSNVYVATGGNGYSAMCSDALGNLSSYVVENNGEFPSNFSKSDFLPLYADQSFDGH